MTEVEVMCARSVYVPGLGGAWKTATFTLWKWVIGWGPFLGELINFAIIALVIFLIAKYLLKEEKVTKK